MKLNLIIKYFFISGTFVLLSFLFNYFLIIKVGTNINFSFILSFIIFNFLSYFFNSKYNFKKKINFKKYLIYIQNTVYTFLSCLILLNILKYHFLIIDLITIIIGMTYISILNFFLNMKTTFKTFV